MTDRYAVIGNPVAHSLSPKIHAIFAREVGHDLAYERILAPLDGFAQSVMRFRAEGGRGLNVTLPFKLEAFALASRLTDRARAAEAVNTLAFDNDDAVLGDNTDGAGLVADITVRLGVTLERKRVLLIGAGGAACGIAGPILDTHPAELFVVNRTTTKAVELAATHASRESVRRTSIRLGGGGFESLAGRQFDVVLNATAASLAGAPLPLMPSIFAPGALAYDFVYADQPTVFMRHASECGAAQVSDGLGMLVAQAAESFLLWRGVRPDVTAALALLRAA